MLLRSILRPSSFIVINFTRSASHYITTPIFYVNSSPHIGHVHTLFLADALNIFNRLRLKDNNTILSTGTDEHGIKIQTAAEANGLSCSDYCDLYATQFAKLFERYNTTVTDFIRTTEDRHEKSVHSLWRELDNRGYIYKGSYSGWYCNSDEVFVPESQVIEKELEGSKIHVDSNDNRLVWSSETNYMFRMSNIEDKVLDWLIRERPVIPEKFNTELLQQCEAMRIGDISISRPKQRLNWGIDVPDDPSQTVYVWLDALSSYLTVAGFPCEREDLRRWPIDCQVFGKDIIKFHAIYWPAFLIALDLPLPKKLICHSHWLVDSLKMSKSRGNVIDPWKENELLTQEGLRYYLLRASTTHSDTDYNQTQAVRRVNSELAGTYGNLMSRCCGAVINPSQTVPTNYIDSGDIDAIRELSDMLNSLGHVCEEHFARADYYKGIDEIMTVLRVNNKLYEEMKPWKLVKIIASDRKAFEAYHNLQAITFETLRVCSILLQPIVPKISKLVLDHIDVKSRSWSDAQTRMDFGEPDQGVRILQNKTSPILFTRIKNQ